MALRHFEGGMVCLWPTPGCFFAVMTSEREGGGVKRSGMGRVMVTMRSFKVLDTAVV